MYEAFYGLREKPFNLTPDPKYLYLSDKHKEAFAHMLFGIKNRSGFVMVTGEIGTGKTTICRNLLNQMDSDTEIAFIFNPFLNPVELLRKINTEFGINTTAENLLGLTEELNIHLLNAGARGKSCVLVIDEAQNLDAKVLEQIRLLSNLETETSKLLQIVLIGQPELGEKLALHELRQLNQRITARYHLTALNQTETLQYIAYRIHVAGGRKGVNFTKGAVNLVYKFSRGTPRVINALCDRALLIGYTKEQRTITAAIIRQAAREIRGEKVAVKRPRERGVWRRFLPSPSLVLAAILLLVLVRYLAIIPIEQATRELGMFNKLISNEEPDAPGPPSPAPAQAQTPPVSAAAQREAPPAPDESLLARRVIDRLATVSRETRGTEDASFALDALAAADAGQARDAGLKLLMGKWGAPDGAAGPLTDNLEDLAGAAAAAGLAWEQLRPVTEQLLAINLPALVRLKLKDELRWFALVSAQDDKLTLALGPAETVSLPKLAFRDIYANEALFFWRDSDPSQPVLQTGQRGKQVATLKGQLRALRLIAEGNSSDVYDGDTAAAVAGVQAEAGLRVDGKAGKQVRMLLTVWTGGEDMPRLRGKRGGEAPAAPAPMEPVAEPSTPAAAAPVAVSEAVAAPAAPAPAPAAKPAAPKAAAKPAPPKQAPAKPKPAETVAAVSPPKPAPPVESPAPAPAPADMAPPTDAEADRRAGDTALVEVKELSAPFVFEPLPPGPVDAEKEQTEPVAGSYPLVPRRSSPA